MTNPIHASHIIVNTNTNNRIESIDLLRGVVMVIMALDHIRDYFHADSFLFSPTDIGHTTLGLFATRWITHLCAPTFILLAGTSAYFMARRKTVKETSFFLLTRGLWLVMLQLTLVRFGWNFDPLFHYNSNTIISVIGLCMIVFSALIYFRTRTIFIIAFITIAGHNVLDKVSFEQGTVADVLWSFLHVQKTYNLGNGYAFSFVYPFIPWVGVMAMGYCLGYLYNSDITSDKRKKILLRLSLISLFFFAVLRYTNIYGDLVPWSMQSDFSGTIMSFFNVTKYPPSLLYLSSTLGISLMMLAFMEGKQLKRLKPFALFGKVAMFYYVVHIYVIHLLALLVVILAGYPWQTMIFYGPISNISPLLLGKFGFSLSQVYLVWVSVVVLLYPLCLLWNSVKIRNKKKWWVSYV
jgi:uncharacterized membrane protein